MGARRPITHRQFITHETSRIDRVQELLKRHPDGPKKRSSHYSASFLEVQLTRCLLQRRDPGARAGQEMYIILLH